VKIKVICIGKTGKSFLIEGEKEYLKRLTHYVPVEKIEIPDIRNAKNLQQNQVKLAEGQEFLAKIESGDVVYLLDEKGKEFTSENFADFFQKRFNAGGKNLVFLIGGAFGFSDEIYERANGKIALSKMTFSHQMVRMIFFEQVYRSMTILRGEPYHHS
jgi:23S rRNA (pseudouridine1915-N3)-methyltransferase|tara:strand:- start:7591 stop:8064 length:474 start_codon:yes stop_codon:yes gene_type:complete